METIEIHDTNEWQSFAEANRDALLDMYPSLNDAMVAACQGGIVFEGDCARDPTLVVFVD